MRDLWRPNIAGMPARYPLPSPSPPPPSLAPRDQSHPKAELESLHKRHRHRHRHCVGKERRHQTAQRRGEGLDADTPLSGLTISSAAVHARNAAHLPAPPAESSSSHPYGISVQRPLSNSLSDRKRKRISRWQREVARDEGSQAVPMFASTYPPTPPASTAPDLFASQIEPPTAHRPEAGPSALPSALVSQVLPAIEVDDDIIALDQPIATARPVLCRIVDVPLKGKGLISTTALTAGQVIVLEHPFIRFTHPINPDALREKYRHLHPDKRKLYRSFTGTAPNIADRIVRIAETNAIPLSTDDSGNTRMHGDTAVADVMETDTGMGGPSRETPSGMFEMICRVNHSCAPNAIWRWNGRKREMALLALMDIPANTEITACYLTDSLVDRAARRDQLEHDFGFICSCSACAKSDDDLKRDEVEIRRIVQLRAVWEGDIHLWAVDHGAAMLRIEEALRIMARQRRVDGQGEILEALFRLHVAWGRRSDAVIAAQRVLNSYRLTIGRDAAAKLEYAKYVESPERALDWLACVAPTAGAMASGSRHDGSGTQDDDAEEAMPEFQDNDEDEDFEMSDDGGSDSSRSEDHGSGPPRRSARYRW